MSKMEGLSAFLDATGKLVKDSKRSDEHTINVGYTADYAAHVHEDMEMVHPRGGQAKFLETPMRTGQRVMANIVEEALLHGRTVVQALEQAGQHLLAESQALVPVDTSELKRSGYVRVE